jgi:DNA invertase Pin-like site-specific DNA recombinase
MSNKAIIYCRVSSKKQVTEGDGLGSQEFRCLQFAASQGLEVDKIFHEEGFTGEGDFMARPSMRKLLEYLEENADTAYSVIFDDLKRFARDTMFHFKLKQELAIRGATPLCPNFKFENTPEGTFVETLYAAFGQLERQQNQRQVVQRMRARMERGYWAFAIPVGYTYTSDPVHGKVAVIDPPSAKIIKTVLEGYAEGILANKGDVRHYLEKNPPMLRGKPMVANYDLVDRMLVNIFYAGLVDYPAWNIHRVKGQHKGIISLATFERIQGRLQERPVRQRLVTNSEFHLTQIVFCGDCGKPFTSSKSRGRSRHYFYYACKNTKCPAKLKNILKEVFEESYLKHLRSIRPSSEIIDLLFSELRRLFKDSRSVHEEQQSRLERKIHAKTQELEKLVKRACEAGSDILKAAYEKQVEVATVELERMKREKIAAKKPDVDDLLNTAEGFMRTAADDWESLDRDSKIDLHQMVFPRPLSFKVGKGWRTAELSFPYKVCRQVQRGDLAMVDIPLNWANRIWEAFITWEPTLRRFFSSQVEQGGRIVRR